MYTILLFPLALLSTFGVYILLGKTKLVPWKRLLLSLVLGILLTAVLFGGLILLSILAFQMNNPITM